jgi:transcriptional regulator with XRE-family HTH domain
MTVINRSNPFRDRREQLGLSQEELARSAGVTAKTVSNWEREISAPPLYRVAELSAAYGVDAPTISAWIVDQTAVVAANRSTG